MTLPLPVNRDDVGNAPGDGPLRAGGVAVAGTPSGANLPDVLTTAAKRQLPALRIMRDTFAGNLRIRERAVEYLPQAPGEDGKNYANRLQRAVFHNFVRSTIEGLVGFVFRRDLEFGDDVPAEILPHLENIDNAGTHVDLFARERMANAMTAGHAFIFVEFPKTGGVQTAGDERRGEVRPYWIGWNKEQVRSWRLGVENGRTYLRQLVIEEKTEEDDGAFGAKCVTRYRVLRRERTPAGAVRVWFELLEIDETKRTVTQVDTGDYPTQEEIPVAEVTTSGRLGLLESDPPFLDLALLNLAHYRQWSDYDTSIHKTCVPIWVESGVTANEDGQIPAIVLGPNASRSSTNPEFKAGYASHDGASLGACKASLDDIKTDMAQMGLAALASSKRVAETATAKELDKSNSDASLAVNARGLQDALERALGFHARYLKLPGGGSVVVNREYEATKLDPAEVQAWIALAKDLGVDLMTVLEALQRGRWIPEDADLEELERDALAVQAANEARRQLALEAQQAQFRGAGGAGQGGAPPMGQEDSADGRGQDPGASDAVS